MLIVFAALGIAGPDLGAWRLGAQSGGGHDRVSSLDVRGKRARRIKTVVRSGGRVDWGAANNLVAFDQLGSDGYYDLFLMNADGTGVRCVTCNASGVPHRHNGNPAWHPSGRYLIFQSEADPPQRGRRGRFGIGEQLEDRLKRVADPGAGFRNNLWVTDARGDRFTQLTEVGPQAAVLHPHFSKDGSKLTWSERLGAGGGAMGRWAIKVADFAMDRDRPRLENIRTYTPGALPRFYETHGFFPDGRSLIISANPEAPQGDYGFDIYRFDLSTERLTNLTNTPNEWDEHSQLSPDGSKIIWMSSRDLGITRLGMATVRSEFWMMNADGSNPTRLTYFNDSSAPEYLNTGLLVAADSSWGPDGRRFLGYVKTDRGTTAGPLFLIDIE